MVGVGTRTSGGSHAFSMNPSQRSEAVAVTVTIATEVGLAADDAIVLHDSNRLAVRLSPADVLARVATPGADEYDVAAFEVKVAHQLARPGSVVGTLDARVEPRVHVRDGFSVTFWTYFEPVPAPIPSADYARALDMLHAEMRRIDVAAPHFTDRVAEARAIVENRAQSPDLGDADRELLTDSLATFERAVVERGADEQLLHGEPHPGNVLNTMSGVRFIDLQTCCHGPLEFDIAHAPSEVDVHCVRADPVNLRNCRLLMTAMVAAWRVDRDDQLPDGRAMLTRLLGELRDARG